MKKKFIFVFLVVLVLSSVGTNVMAVPINCTNGAPSCSLYTGTGLLGSGFFARQYCLPCGQAYNNGFQCGLGHPNDGTPISNANLNCFCHLPASLCYRPLSPAGTQNCSAQCQSQPCLDPTNSRLKMWRTPENYNFGCVCI